MATFNQQNQTVQYQYNAEIINFDQVKTSDNFFQELKLLQAELKRAIEAKTITGENALDAENYVNKALLQADEPTPNKKTLIECLNSAKQLVSSAEGLATAFAGAIITIGALF